MFWGYKEKIQYNTGSVKQPVFVDAYLYTYIDYASANKRFEDFWATELNKDDFLKEKMNVYSKQSYMGELFMIMSERVFQKREN